MLNRLLPGLLVAAILAIVFGGPEDAGVPGVSDERRGGRREASLSERILFSGMPEQAAAQAAARTAEQPVTRAAEKSLAARGSAAAPRHPVSSAPPPVASSFPPRSSNAYASMTLPEDFVAESETALFPPARGLRVWAAGGTARSKQEISPDDSAAYRMTEKRYSAGIAYDWSVDTVLGAGVEMLDATVKSGAPYDARESRVDGVFATASVDTVLFDSWLLGLKGFYGKLDHGDGGGIVGAWDDGGATKTTFQEEAHGSSMYGLSAKLSVPMLLWGHRVVADAGIDYRRITTEAHGYRVASAGLLGERMEQRSSSSLAFPFGFSMEKDFVRPWGLVTPRFGAGFTYETSKTASGVRALHALSAAPVYFDSGGFHREPLPFESLPGGMYHVALGVGVKTVGGWDASLDYRRDFAGGYTRDSFKLELGRSF